MSHVNEISDLINSSAGKAAPYITEKLRLIGDGKMSAGVTALTKYAAKKWHGNRRKNRPKERVRSWNTQHTHHCCHSQDGFRFSP